MRQLINADQAAQSKSMRQLRNADQAAQSK